jgi:hypothetical protein
MRVPDGIDPMNAVNKDTYNVPGLQGRWDPENDDFNNFSVKTFKAYYD